MTQFRSALCATFLMVLTACAGVNDQTNDPMEPLNRNIFAFNEVLDNVIIAPIAEAYRFIMPEDGRIAVRNFLRNLGEPVNVANAALQGDVDRAFTSFWRFTLNTTLGFGGLYDFAGNNSPLKYRPEDFGQTLAVWAGNDRSAYFVIPVLGPSTVRDTVGRVVDVFINPWTYALETEESIAIGVANGVTKREQILDLTKEIEETSFDPYATYRSIYLQNRAKQIKNRQPSNREFVDQ